MLGFLNDANSYILVPGSSLKPPPPLMGLCKGMVGIGNIYLSSIQDILRPRDNEHNRIDTVQQEVVTYKDATIEGEIFNAFCF